MMTAPAYWLSAALWATVGTVCAPALTITKLAYDNTETIKPGETAEPGSYSMAQSKKIQDATLNVISLLGAVFLALAFPGNEDPFLLTGIALFALGYVMTVVDLTLAGAVRNAVSRLLGIKGEEVTLVEEDLPLLGDVEEEVTDAHNQTETEGVASEDATVTPDPVPSSNGELPCGREVSPVFHWTMGASRVGVMV